MSPCKRDLVEEAQQVMNANRSLGSKNLISGLANEIVALRCEIERLENLLHPTSSIKMSTKWSQGVPLYES